MEDKSDTRRAAPWWQVPPVVAVAVGILLGLGAFTFRYAEGLSYLSSDEQGAHAAPILAEVFGVAGAD